MMRPGLDNQCRQWPDVPDTVRVRVERLVQGLAEILADDLLAVYLHGSRSSPRRKPPPGP